MAKQVTENAGAKLVMVSTANKYNPRAGTAQGNADSWKSLTAFLAKQKGSKATISACAAHLQAERNHAPFVGYCIRRGWLVVTK